MINDGFSVHFTLAGTLTPDRACLALAIHKELPVLTADLFWVKLDWPIKIKLLR